MTKIRKMGRGIIVAMIVIVVVGVDGRSTPKRDSNTQQTNWKEFFCSTWFHWPWLENSGLMTYSRERVPRIRSFDQGCEVDVGTCPVGSCFKCPYSGYICPQTETRTHTCEDAGTWEYEYVTQCVCCRDHGLTVNVKVVDSETKAGIEGISIRFGKDFIGYSDANGQLMNVIPSDTRNLVISATDTKNDNYVSTVKIYDILEGLQNSMEAEIVMVQKTFSLEFDSTKSKTICLSENQNCLESNDGTPKLEISPRSFRKGNRQIYRGSVKVSISILDVSTENTNEIMPGRYESKSGNIVNTLVPLLTFAIDFRDSNNRKLRIIKSVKIYSSSDTIWNIDLRTGFWEEARTTSGTKRRKRQATDQASFSARLVNGNWMTLGQITSLPSCYIKTRVFGESGTEMSDSLTTFYQPEIIALNNNDQKIQYYFEPTKTLENTCFEVNCPTDPTLSGNIQLKAIENVDMSSTSAVTYLIPKPLDDYESTVKAKHETVEYNPTTDLEKPATHAKFISNTDGPFYEDLVTCELSDVSQPAFHYIRHDLSTSLSPSTINAELCTARIGFNDPGNIFFTYLEGLSQLPIIKAVSAWRNGNDEFYFTDFKRIEYSNIENFYFACVKYRCAPPAEEPFDESIGDTVLYLDLLLPKIVDIDVNGDGNTVKQSVNCQTGKCHGNFFCKSQAEYKKDKEMDGSVWVTRGNDVPEKFFLPESDPLATDSCSASTNKDDFAHSVACHFGDPQK